MAVKDFIEALEAGLQGWIRPVDPWISGLSRERTYAGDYRLPALYPPGLHS